MKCRNRLRRLWSNLIAAAKSAWFRIAAWVVFVLIATIVMSLMCWVWLSSNGESGSSTMRNIVLMAAAVIALPLAIWRSVVAERQADTARKQAETAQQGLLNERYQQGAEMIGSNLLSVRLGGIYALQRLAKEHPEQYHVQTIRLFCAFVRHPTKDDGEENPMRLREDVQAIMTAIGSRSETGLDYEKTEDFRLELAVTNLSGARLNGANLSGAHLSGVNLAYAYLVESDLSGADLASTNLSYAHLIRANLSDSELPIANLSHTISQGTDFARAQLGGANLSHADLVRANLSDANIGTADLSHAKLRDTNLSGAVFGKRTRVTPSDSPISEDVFARLTQTQLDEARADPGNPPKIDCGTVDIETGEPLVWRGKPPKKKIKLRD